MCRVVVRSYKALKHIDESRSVLICKVCVQCISECHMSPFNDRAFHVGVLAHVEQDASTCPETVCLQILFLYQSAPRQATYV